MQIESSEPCFGLKQTIIEKINAVFANYATIEQAILYGSRAKGCYRQGSDIDLTLKGNVTNEDFNKLWQKLDDSYIPYKFDISIYSNLKSENLIEHINQVGKIFYKRKY